MIETETLRLVPVAPKHFVALIKGDYEFSAAFGMPAADGLRDFIVSEEVPESFLDMLGDSEETDPWQWGFFIVHRTQETVIGNAGFKGEPDASGRVEIAYAVVPTFENMGHATAAAKMLTQFAFQNDGVREVFAHTLPQKNASTRVLEKSGFEKIGDVVEPDDGTVWRWQFRK